MLNKEKKKKEKTIEKRQHLQLATFKAWAMKRKAWAINANPKVQHNFTAEFGLE